MANQSTNLPVAHSICVAESVPDFLNYLMLSAPHWKSAKRGEIAYRGQSSSEWPLLPKAFREHQTVGYEVDAQSGFAAKVVSQAQAEFKAVHQFAVAADAAGLPITETGSRLLLQDNPRHVFDDPYWEYSWPRPDIVEMLALAQHHGVPTRLLDFTEDPWVAAYFASISAWEDGLVPNVEEEDHSYLSVWAIDLRFVRAVGNISHRYPERIAEVHVPRANNSYLKAQFGFFLIDRGANDVMGRRESLSLDRAVVDRASFWATGRRLTKYVSEPTWFDDVPVKQVNLPRHYAVELLQELANRGITKGSLMPNLDRIVESLELQRVLAIRSAAAASVRSSESDAARS